MCRAVAFIGAMALVFAFDHACEAAIELNFTKVTNNNVEDLSGQLLLRILTQSEASSQYGKSIGANEVLMVLTNNVGIASNIAEFYIDDGTILSQSAVLNSLTGYTDFSGGGASPGNLPGGNSVDPPFVATGTFSADVNSGNPSKGIDASGDTLGIVYALQSTGLTGGSADLSKIQNYIDSGELRFGLHIRSIGVAGGSDSYINEEAGNTEGVIPEPASLAVWGLLACTGMGGVVARRRRNRARDQK